MCFQESHSQPRGMTRMEILTGGGGRMWLRFCLLHLPECSGGDESFTDRVVCFPVLQSRPNTDHVCRPRHAAVRDTEQFPGIPGNEVSQYQAFLPQSLPSTVSLRGLGDLPWDSTRGEQDLGSWRQKVCCVFEPCHMGAHCRNRGTDSNPRN